MNAARWFERREDYQPRQTPLASPFRKFDMKCLVCGSYQLRLVAQTHSPSFKEYVQATSK